MKKLLSVVLVLALALTFVPAAFAALGDDSAGTIGGVAVTMGTGGATLAGASGGSVTLTTAQATNATATFTDSGATNTNIYWYDSTTFGSADPENDTTYNPKTLLDGDIIVVAFIETANTLFFKIDVTVSDGATPPAGGSGTGSETVTGDGTTEYIDLEIYEVTLPTAATLHFTLDPQGLMAIEDGQIVDLAALEGGKIITTDAPKAINNSAKDITLSVALTATGDATFLPYDTNDEDTVAAVDADTNNNILLYAVPSSADIINEETEYAASANGYVITKAASTLKFVLKAAEYAVKNEDGEYTAAPKINTGHGTAIQLGGLVNSTADWSDYVGTDSTPAAKVTGVSAVFSYAKATDEESITEPVEGIPGLITDADALAVTPAVVEVGFADGTPLLKTIPTASIASPLVLRLNFLETTVTAITSLTNMAVQASNYTVNYTAGTITFTAERTALYKNLTADSGIKITLSDGTVCTVNFDVA